MKDYKSNPEYKALETILKNAGMTIIYQDVSDGARSDYESMSIVMPEAPDAFPNIQVACATLGHEAGHILTRLDSVDWPPEERIRNEAICDLIGVYLYKLAEMTAGFEIEKTMSL